MLKDERQVILFCPIHPTSLNKMLHIAKSLNGEYIKSVFLISNNYTAAQQSNIKSRGFELAYVGGYDSYIEYLENKEVKRPKLDFGNFFLKWRGVLYEQARRLPFAAHYFLEKERLHRIELQRKLKKEYQFKKQEACKLFDKINPNKLVVAGDRHLRYEVAVLYEANCRKVPILIPPISVFRHPNEIARARFLQSKEFDVTNLPEIKKRWPKQCEDDKYGNQASFYHYWMLEPLDDLGLLPENPWVMGDSYADTIMVSGQHEASRLLSNGLAKSKLVITGDSEFDELYNCLQDKHCTLDSLSKKYAFSKKDNIIVVALPQLYEHGLLNYEEHWKVINRICETLSNTNSTVLVSLHPKMQLKEL